MKKIALIISLGLGNLYGANDYNLDRFIVYGALKALIDGHDSIPEQRIKLRPFFTRICNGDDENACNSHDLKWRLKEWFPRRNEALYSVLCSGLSVYFYDNKLSKNNNVSDKQRKEVFHGVFKALRELSEYDIDNFIDCLKNSPVR